MTVHETKSSLHPVGSVFIMDVSQSSKFENPDELTSYLNTVVGRVARIKSRSGLDIAFKYRNGDEIVCVSRGFCTAYLLAYFMMTTWKYPAHHPYFGCAFGELGNNFPEGEELDVWNSPLLKQARNASDDLKASRVRHREWLKFDTSSSASRELSSLLNDYASFQDRFFKAQSSTDRIAAFLYQIETSQEDIAKTLGKHPSTISRQVRKSNIDLIVRAKERIVQFLESSEWSSTSGLWAIDEQIVNKAACRPEENSDSNNVEKRQSQTVENASLALLYEIKEEILGELHSE